MTDILLVPFIRAAKMALVSIFLNLCIVWPQTETGSRGPSLAIIDDSADMAGRDGLSISSQRMFPILSYLFSSIEAKTCCYWSAFSVKGLECTRSAAPQCSVNNVRVPPLTMTSPLVPVIEAAVANPADRDLYLITNGLDWRTEGNDRRYRVEMDIGDVLARWIGS